MIAEKDLILAIQFYPELYAKNGTLEKKKKQELWMEIAEQTNIKSGAAAEKKWLNLISKYVSCLVNGTPFAYEREMQYMQTILVGAGSSADAQSDSDIDEVELRKILNSYENSPTAVKRSHTETADANEESIPEKEYKNDEYNIPKKKVHSTVTNATTKRSSDVLNNAKAKILRNNISRKHKSNRDSAEKANTDSNILNASIVQPTSMPANNSSEENEMSSSFTNLTSLELIFLGYAKLLQRMPLRLQLLTKRKIADIMDEAELKMCEEN